MLKHLLRTYNGVTYIFDYNHIAGNFEYFGIIEEDFKLENNDCTPLSVEVKDADSDVIGHVDAYSPDILIKTMNTERKDKSEIRKNGKLSLFYEGKKQRIKELKISDIMREEDAESHEQFEKWGLKGGFLTDGKDKVYCFMKNDECSGLVYYEGNKDTDSLLKMMPLVFIDRIIEYEYVGWLLNK